MTSTASNSEACRIEDYLRGRLTEEETRQFEIRMLEDDELFAQVQREDLLRQGLAKQSYKASDLKSESIQQGNSGRKTYLIRWLQPVLTGAFAIAVIALGIHNLDLRQQLEQMEAPRPGIPVITLHDQRALLPGTQAQPNEFDNISGPILLEIDVSAHEEQEFQVEIQTTHDTYTYERVQADMRGYLTVLLPASASAITVKNMRNEQILHRTFTEQGNI